MSVSPGACREGADGGWPSGARSLGPTRDDKEGELFRFLVKRMLLTPPAMLVALHSLLNLFFVAERMIIHLVALTALEFDEVILGHK